MICRCIRGKLFEEKFPPDPLQNLFAENPLPTPLMWGGRGSFTKRFGGGFGRRPFLKRSLPSISADNIIKGG